MTRFAPEKPLSHITSIEPAAPISIPSQPLGESGDLSDSVLRSNRKSVWRGVLGWSGLVAAGFLGGWYYGGWRSAQHSQITLSGGGPDGLGASNAIPVTAEPTVPRSVARTVSAVGSLHAFEEVVVSSKVEGRVQRIVSDVSTRVGPGEVLLELDATDARLAVQQAERSLQAELAKWGFPDVPDENVDLSPLPSVRSAKARFELSKARFERMQNLKSTGSVSDDDFDQARTDLGVLDNEWRKEQLLAQSSAAVARLRAADLAIAQQRLADCQVRAPIPSLTDPEHEPEYIISERLVSEGSLLRPGTDVFRLVLGRTLKLRLSVPEIHAGAVQVGQRVDVFPSSVKRPLAGTVAKVAPSVDRATRTFMVEVYVTPVAGTLKPGGFAKASICVSESEQAMTVPVASLYSLAGVQKIFVIQDGTAREYQVVLGEQSKDWVEIAQPPIPAGAMVITSGQRLLSDGVPIKLRDQEGPEDRVPPQTNQAERPS